jgi:hypothetical protein
MRGVTEGNVSLCEDMSLSDRERVEGFRGGTVDRVCIPLTIAGRRAHERPDDGGSGVDAVILDRDTP